MNQIQLETAIRTTLLQCLPVGWSLPVVLGNQPRRQGRADGIYFFRIGDGKRGWQMRKYHSDDANLVLTESQWSETQYQFQALIEEDEDAVFLAADAIDVVRSIAGSLIFVESLAKLKIGVQRPSSILTPVFVNDRDEYEAVPNFTITFSHKRDLQMGVPYTEKLVARGIYRV